MGGKMPECLGLNYFEQYCDYMVSKRTVLDDSCIFNKEDIINIAPKIDSEDEKIVDELVYRNTKDLKTRKL